MRVVCTRPDGLKVTALTIEGALSEQEKRKALRFAVMMTVAAGKSRFPTMKVYLHRDEGRLILPEGEYTFRVSA